MKLSALVFVASVMLVAASPVKDVEEPVETHLAADLKTIEELAKYEEAAVQKRSCIVGSKNIGETCVASCQCCGATVRCIGEGTKGICNNYQTNNILGQILLYAKDTVVNTAGLLVCAQDLSEYE
uniref:U13-hexatoxin-Mg1a n=1 Tax=Macrothele gigas TaxID=223896 RepID=TX33A_MACGS|nr:RecName: Full=U13-hexatoxin-Mg1a; Short=U13-HXTX-Mg1a; AltName: Full=Neurotoxin magi-12; Flags: Precursor [Macrothele gigas]BAD13411.1 peptide toxin 7 precursor [Macrothele gigas]